MNNMNYENITDFCDVILFGGKNIEQKALFTNMRINRTTIPKGKYAYDLRSTDNNDGFCSIEPFVRVNHGGTIICDKPIEMIDGYHLLDWYDVNFV